VLKVVVARKISGERLNRWRRLIGLSLRRLDDRIWLANSPLAQLKCVQSLAERKYADRFRREGLALREILIDACDAASAEFAGSPSATVLETVVAGGTVAGFAARHELDRTVAHRRYWRPVLDFIVEYVLDLEVGLRDAA